MRHGRTLCNGFLAAAACAALVLAGCSLGGSGEKAKPAADEAPAAATAKATTTDIGKASASASTPDVGKASASASTPDVGKAAAGGALVAILNARLVDGVLVGGQPTADQLAEIARAGYGTVINLRMGDEPGVIADEAARVEGLGMRYVWLPVPGPEGITEDNARALDRALAEASGPAVIHCTSGERVAALLALRAHHVKGASPADAVAEGERAGLVKLAPKVREQLKVQ